jgi:hypothetical protein
LFGRKIDPELKSMGKAFNAVLIRVHGFIVHDAIACFHPLHTARTDPGVMPPAVPMFSLPMYEVSEGSNTPVRMSASGKFFF